MIVQAAKRKSLHEQALRHSARTGLAVIGLFGGTLGLWAATASLSGAVVAPGQFVVNSYVKKVQHPTGGIVGELRVREGDRVKEGDLLVRLDETITRANLQLVSKQLDENLARQARLEAERDGAAEVALPTEFASRANEPGVVKLIAAPAERPRARRREHPGSARPAHRGRRPVGGAHRRDLAPDHPGRRGNPRRGHEGAA